jgi:hypothetical protein
VRDGKVNKRGCRRSSRAEIDSGERGFAQSFARLPSSEVHLDGGGGGGPGAAGTVRIGIRAIRVRTREMRQSDAARVLSGNPELLFQTHGGDVRVARRQKPSSAATAAATAATDWL